MPPSRWLVVLVASAPLLVASPALAMLGAPEEAQVREAYTRGDVALAASARAALARPDVTPEEAGKVLADAARKVPFDDKRRAFVHELLFAPAALASRSALAPAVVEALLGRSAEVAGGTGNDASRARELLRIHRFVARDIASAGKPPRDGHDAASGIQDDALKAAIALYRKHLELPLWDRARLPPGMVEARAQVDVALVELAAGIAPRSDVAAWIGLGPSARSAFERAGVLVVGLEASTAKAGAVLSMIGTAQAASHGASVLWIDKTRPVDLAARREVVTAGVGFRGAQRVDPARLWPRAVDPVQPDAALAEVAWVLARAAVGSVQASSPPAAEAATKALDRARRAGLEAGVLAPAAVLETLDRAGEGGAISRESLVAHAGQLLLLDASHAVSVALARALVSRYEPMEQLALALGALAAADDGKLRSPIELGRTGEGGLVTPAQVEVHGTPDRVTDFKIDGHTFALGRDDSGAIHHVERDGKPLTLAGIPFARLPTSTGDAWTGNARAKRVALTRLVGAPEVGFGDDGRILVRGGATPKTFDAVSTKAPGPDASIEADVRAIGGPALVIARASASPGLAGVALVLTPSPLRAALVLLDGAGGSTPLGAPVAIGRVLTGGGVHVKVDVKKRHVDALVGGERVSADLPDSAPTSGDFAFSPGERDEVEIRNLRVIAR